MYDVNESHSILPVACMVTGNIQTEWGEVDLMGKASTIQPPPFVKAMDYETTHLYYQGGG